MLENVFQIKVSADHEAIIKKCDFYAEYYNFKSDDNSWFKNRKSSWRHFRNITEINHNLVPNQPHTWPECVEILEQIRPYYNLNINWSWYTIMLHGGEFPSHAHPSMSGLTGVYYPQCDSTNSAFEYMVNNEWKSIKVTTGDFLLFSNMLIHRVPRNVSLQNRYSIGFGHFNSYNEKIVNEYYLNNMNAF